MPNLEIQTKNRLRHLPSVPEWDGENVVTELIREWVKAEKERYESMNQLMTRLVEKLDDLARRSA